MRVGSSNDCSAGALLVGPSGFCDGGSRAASRRALDASDAGRSGCDLPCDGGRCAAAPTRRGAAARRAAAAAGALDIVGGAAGASSSRAAAACAGLASGAAGARVRWRAPVDSSSGAAGRDRVALRRAVASAARASVERLAGAFGCRPADAASRRREFGGGTAASTLACSPATARWDGGVRRRSAAPSGGSDAGRSRISCGAGASWSASGVDARAEADGGSARASSAGRPRRCRRAWERVEIGVGGRIVGELELARRHLGRAACRSARLGRPRARRVAGGMPPCRRDSSVSPVSTMVASFSSKSPPPRTWVATSARRGDGASGGFGGSLVELGLADPTSEKMSEFSSRTSICRRAVPAALARRGAVESADRAAPMSDRRPSPRARTRPAARARSRARSAWRNCCSAGASSPAVW